MSGSQNDETTCGEQADEIPRAYLCLKGRVHATPSLVRDLVTAGFVSNLVYNATVDRRVPFAVGIEHRLASSEAKREGRPFPPEPDRSERFLPLPDEYAVRKELTVLCGRHPLLRRFPRTMLDQALAEGCEAVEAHVAKCVEAKAAGRRLPKLSFRSLRDGVTVGTVAFRMARTGDGPVLTKPKRTKTPKAEASRRRRERDAEKKKQEWVETKKTAGWPEARIEEALRQKGVRSEKDRLRQRKLDEERRAEPKPTGRPRRDSPKALPGEDKLKIDVQGVGRFRARLTREMPEGSEPTLVRLLKKPGHDAPVEIRVTVRAPVAPKRLDPMSSARLIHGAVRHLPEDAPPLAFVEAARAAGLRVRGEDLNATKPSVDDEGFATKRVERPRKEVARAKDLLRRISFKDLQVWKEEQEAAEKENRKPSNRKRRSASNRRSKDAAELRRIQAGWADRNRTMACQGASRLVRSEAERPLPILVATDPKRMVAPLLKLDGPAERRAAAAENMSVPMVASADASTSGFVLSAKNRRTMRSNLHANRLGLRIDRTAELCRRDGVIHATPGHEGTTSTCPSCNAYRKKGLEERKHRCVCGFVMDRDQASALTTLGRALATFRADPVGPKHGNKPDVEASGEQTTGRGGSGRTSDRSAEHRENQPAARLGEVQTETLPRRSLIRFRHTGRAPDRRSPPRRDGSIIRSPTQGPTKHTKSTDQAVGLAEFGLLRWKQRRRHPFVFRSCNLYLDSATPARRTQRSGCGSTSMQKTGKRMILDDSAQSAGFRSDARRNRLDAR